MGAWASADGKRFIDRYGRRVFYQLVHEIEDNGTKCVDHRHVWKSVNT